MRWSLLSCEDQIMYFLLFSNVIRRQRQSLRINPLQTIHTTYWFGWFRGKQPLRRLQRLSRGLRVQVLQLDFSRRVQWRCWYVSYSMRYNWSEWYSTIFVFLFVGDRKVQDRPPQAYESGFNCPLQLTTQWYCKQRLSAYLLILASVCTDKISQSPVKYHSIPWQLMCPGNGYPAFSAEIHTH